MACGGGKNNLQYDVGRSSLWPMGNRQVAQDFVIIIRRVEVGGCGEDNNAKTGPRNCAGRTSIPPPYEVREKVDLNNSARFLLRPKTGN